MTSGRWSFVAILVLSFSLATPAFAQPDVSESTVVFVCEHGAAKSVIAAAHFNRLAVKKGLPYRAVARGTHPDEKIAPGVHTGLA